LPAAAREGGETPPLQVERFAASSSRHRMFVSSPVLVVAAAMERIMDRHAKVVLTVIALALVVIAFQNSGVIPAYAQSAGPVIVRICGPDHWGKVDCVGVSEGRLFVRP
jgi:hypothetical protein